MEESNKSNKRKRKTVVYHTRDIDRNIARRNMRNKGMVQINKRKDGKDSYFAMNWRNYIY